MTKLTDAEASGLRRAAQSEHVARRAAAAAVQAFGAVAVFEHLAASAERHIDMICEILHGRGANPPVLELVPPTTYGTVVEALTAAADRETQTAAIYDELLQSTKNDNLKLVVLPLWQSVSHLHLTAIADQLEIERQKTV